MENKYGTATTRQRWALYCIAKKDYREVVLSKEEAAELSMDEKSVVETEWNGDVKRFAFIGVGCGITYLTHRKGNKKAEAIKAAANKLHFGLAQTWFLNKFTEEQKNYYERIGCPLGAIWQQDMNMQQAYYYKVLDFAKSKGVNMDVKSYLD